MLCTWSHTSSGHSACSAIPCLFCFSTSVQRAPWRAPVSLLTLTLWRMSCLTPAPGYFNTAATNVHAGGFVGTQVLREAQVRGDTANTAWDLDQAVPAAGCMQELLGSTTRFTLLIGLSALTIRYYTGSQMETGQVRIWGIVLLSVHHISVNLIRKVSQVMWSQDRVNSSYWSRNINFFLGTSTEFSLIWFHCCRDYTITQTEAGQKCNLQDIYKWGSFGSEFPECTVSSSSVSGQARTVLVVAGYQGPIRYCLWMVSRWGTLETYYLFLCTKSLPYSSYKINLFK